MFYIIADELFHTVLKDADGEWIISYDNSASPTYVSDDLLKKYQKVKAPDKYIENKDRELSEAEKQRKNMIQPLLDDIQCIKCKKKADKAGKKYCGSIRNNGKEDSAAILSIFVYWYVNKAQTT